MQESKQPQGMKQDQGLFEGADTEKPLSLEKSQSSIQVQGLQ